MTASDAIFLNDCAVLCALGSGQDAVRQALLRTDQPGGVAPTPPYGWVGAVGTPLDPLTDAPVPWRSRNNALLRAAVRQLGPSLERLDRRRLAVVLGTSTSGVLEGETAVAAYARSGAWPPDYHYCQQEIGAPAEFIARELGAAGPAYVISTACSSSARALASATRLIRAGVADAVIAGGADALCGLTVGGFTALGQVAPQRCNPMSKNRRGINVGEGAALFVVSRVPGPVRLAGVAENSDAYHVSSPEPTGARPSDAVRQTLAQARIEPGQVDYVNLHGTATEQNDAMESQQVLKTLGPDVPVSSTKPLTGHTLGAAGAIEAALCWVTLVGNPEGFLPPHWWDGIADPALPTLHWVRPGERLGRPPRFVLSQSYAFGGSNAVLLLERVGGAG